MGGTIRPAKSGAKSTWQIRYDGPPGPDGSRHQKSETFEGSKKLAEARLRELLTQVERGLYVEPTKDTVGAYLERWLFSYAGTNCTPRTLQGYKGNLRRYVIPVLGGIRLQGLQSGHVQHLYADLLDQQHLSSSTVLHVHRVLSGALKMAVKWDLVVRNVCEAVSPPRPDRKEAPVWSDVTVGRFLAAAEGRRFRDFYFFAVLTGMRRSEIAGLRWEHIDLQAGRLSVVQTRQRVTGRGVLVGKPKTSKSRRAIALDEDAINLLHQIRGRQVVLAAQLGETWEPNGYVFVGSRGKPVDPDDTSRDFGGIVKAAGLPHLTLHGLRHVHATRLLQKGVHVKIVSERLGHSNISITLDTYSHVLPGLQESAIRDMGGRIFNV